MSEAYDEVEVGALAGRIDAWLESFRAGNDAVEAIARDPAEHALWYVRLAGESKEHITVWLRLGQRTLRYEAYVMPAPEENAAAVYEMALRHNQRLVGAHFAIGVESALFLRGELPVAALDEDELDRIVGSLYAYVEHCFPAMIRLGFASRFTADAEAGAGD